MDFDFSLDNDKKFVGFLFWKLEIWIVLFFYLFFFYPSSHFTLLRFIPFIYSILEDRFVGLGVFFFHDGHDCFGIVCLSSSGLVRYWYISFY